MPNPMTILPFAGFIAVIEGGITPLDLYSRGLVVLEIIPGSFLWWVILAVIITCFRSRFTDKVRFFVNQVSGAVIILFGVLAIISISPAFTR